MTRTWNYHPPPAGALRRLTLFGVTPRWMVFVAAATMALGVSPAWPFGTDSAQPPMARSNAPLPAGVVPPELQGVGITERLGESVALGSIRFKDESGETVTLAKYFSSRRPVLLNIVYYGCPSLCGLVLNGVLEGLKELDWSPGEKFEVVTVSMDHREGPELARGKKESMLKSLGRPGAENAWHFLTGEEAEIRKLAAQVGFGFRWEEKQKEYAHAAGIFLLTPEGRISRVLYGIQYTAKNLKLALLEASDGRIGTIVDRFVLLCFRYDPTKRGYSFAIARVMQASGAGTVLVFGGYLALFWRRQRRLARHDGGPPGGQG